MDCDNRSNYDLEERTSRFGESIIKFCRNIKRDVINDPIVNQLVRSGTSVGANYREANSASSRKDFRNKIYICKKEAEETKYWLDMIAVSSPENKNDAKIHWQESKELTLIFGKIVSKLN